MSPRITHIDPEETIRKLKAKVDRLEKALAKQPAQQALDKMAENARELGLDYEPAQQQEPVAWVCYGAPGKRDIDFEEADINRLPIGTQLYTSPPAQRKPLTDEDCTRIYNEANGITTKNPPITTERIFKAMRAAYGIKENT